MRLTWRRFDPIHSWYSTFPLVRQPLQVPGKEHLEIQPKSVCLSFFQSSLHFFHFHPLCLFLSLSLPLSSFLPLSSLSICPSLFLPGSFFHSLFLSPSPSVCLSLCFLPPLCPTPSFYSTLCLCLSLHLCLFSCPKFTDEGSVGWCSLLPKTQQCLSHVYSAAVSWLNINFQ